MIFDKFKDLHIGVIGDLILDEYIYGQVNRISPEGPIPVVDLTGQEYRPGGAANVALNLKNLGVKTSIFGMVGEDHSGNILEGLIRDISISNTLEIIKDPMRITTCKTRVVAQNQQVVRIDHEDRSACSDIITDRIIEALRLCHAEFTLDAVILQDYEKGMLHEKNIPVIIKSLKEMGIRIIVDPKDKNFWFYQGVDIIKPNRKEAETALKQKINMAENDLRLAAEQIENVLNNSFTVITLSEHGIYIKSNQNNIWQRSVTLNVVDVCGAGDAVISVISAAYCAGLTIDEIAGLSNLSGAIVCSIKGVAAVDLELLRKTYLNRSY